MAVLLASDYGADAALWRECLRAGAGEIDLRLWPDLGDPADIEVILIDSASLLQGRYGLFPRLRWVAFLGHGASDLLRDASLPASVQVTRLKDPNICRGLTEYIVHAVTAHHLGAREYARQQQERRWQRLNRPAADQFSVAVLGLGSIGLPAACVLRDLGFRISGWTRTPQQHAEIECVHGDDALMPLLGRSDYVVAVLPETDRTVGLFSRSTFAAMKRGAYLVNVGRGTLVVEQDLLAALDDGQLAGACLDVFATEPLPPDSPLWSHPKVTVTPHTGGTDNGTAHMAQVVDNYRRLIRGEPLLNLAERARGY